MWVHGGGRIPGLKGWNIALLKGAAKNPSIPTFLNIFYFHLNWQVSWQDGDILSSSRFFRGVPLWGKVALHHACQRKRQESIQNIYSVPFKKNKKKNEHQNTWYETKKADQESIYNSSNSGSFIKRWSLKMGKKKQKNQIK